MGQIKKILQEEDQILGEEARVRIQWEEEEMSIQKKNGTKLGDPKYITENKQWDSDWLQKLYPHKFKNK